LKKSTILSTAIILILGSFLSSCDIVNSLQPVHPAGASGEILFSDDFSVTPNGWGTMGRDGGLIGFDYEGLTLKVMVPNYLVWTVNGDRFTDTRIDVDAVLLDGPTNDNFGVICRFVDNENFYAFVISHDGYYGIFKMLEGEMVLASQDGNLNFSKVIRQGGIVNHLQAVCSQDTLSLTVNDQILAEVKDNSFTDGQVGLIAGAYDLAGVQVLFDNLKVVQP
jgi:hypothetical protein